MKSYLVLLKVSIIFLAMLIFNTCASTDAQRSKDQIELSPHIESQYFDISNTIVPNEQFEKIRQGLLKAEDVLSDSLFLEELKNKNDWRYSPKKLPNIAGEQVIGVIRGKKHVITLEDVRPKLFFYTPPNWGKDVCGGVSLGFFKKTKSTGCMKNGDIYKNLLAVGDSWDIFSEFAVHEWLHVAGFGHGGNRNQCIVEKRNSVPIYVGCAAKNHLLGLEIEHCADSSC